MGGGSIQVLGFKGRWLGHKKNMCPQVPPFSDMDISSISWAAREGRGSARSEKGHGPSPGLSTTMRKVRRFNLGVVTQQLKGSSPEGDAVQPSSAFVTSAAGTRRGSGSSRGIWGQGRFHFLDDNSSGTVHQS